MTAVSRAGEGYYVGDLEAVEEILRVAGDDQDWRSPPPERRSVPGLRCTAPTAVPKARFGLPAPDAASVDSPLVGPSAPEMRQSERVVHRSMAAAAVLGGEVTRPLVRQVVICRMSLIS